MQRAIFFMIIITLCAAAAMAVDSGSMAAMLPGAAGLQGWQLAEKPRVAVGEDLFLLINGGADLYYEYGFKQAVNAGYKKGGRTINIEIYEMNTPAAAYGVFTFKTGDSGKKLSIGSSALLEDYYLNCWQGNFLITLTGFDAEKETLDGLEIIARAAVGKIAGKPGAGIPPLVALLPRENLEKPGIKYLRGLLGLFNNYDFASVDIFGVKEGVIGSYGDYKIFIFKYENQSESRKRFRDAAAHLKKSSRFKDFTRSGDAISMIDKEGKPLYIKPYKNYILAVLGKTPARAEIMLQKMTSSWGRD